MAFQPHQIAFVKKHFPYAYATWKQTGVPVLVTLGQAALESAWGQAAPGNNYFGIKADASWRGPFQVLTTREFENGQYVTKQLKFRKYSSPQQSFNDHAQFLLDNSRYAPAFQYKNNPTQFAREVAKAGYATAPDYANVLIGVMNNIRKMAQEAQIDLKKTGLSITGPLLILGVALVIRVTRKRNRNTTHEE